MKERKPDLMENRNINKDRLLIVDDEKDMLTGLKRMISNAIDELEVITTDNGLEALEIVRSGQVDIALFDIQINHLQPYQDLIYS